MATTNDKLSKLRKKLGQMDVGGGGGNEGFWKPPAGDSVIRILPEVGQMEFFFQEVGQHYLPDGKFVKCPKFTTSGEYDCPICDMVSRLWKGTEDDKALASKTKVNKRYWMNIVVRDKDDERGNTGTGPYIFTPGSTIFQSIINYIDHPDYGDIVDEAEGFDLILTRRGTGLETEYEVAARRLESPLHANEDKADEIFENAADLSWVMLSDDPEEDDDLGKGVIVKLMPYERMVSEYGIDASTTSYDLQAQGSGNGGGEVGAAIRRERSRRSSRH